MTHLILHKVRGQPAFDVAEEIMIGDEKGWIIPTSGHRAYPYKIWLINDLSYEDQGHIYDSPIPVDWPDHYQVKKEPKMEINIGQLISGLVKFKRRF